MKSYRLTLIVCLLVFCIETNGQVVKIDTDQDYYEIHNYSKKLGDEK